MEFVNVCGYLSSGSSAAVDYIREFSNIAVCKTEIRFIRDPFGIIDLDYALTQKWENERASYAIWKFLDYSKKWSRFNRNILSPAGHSYKKFLNKNYNVITRKYIDSFTDFRTIMSHYCTTFDQNYFFYVINRVRKNIEKKLKSKVNVASRRQRKIYFAHPTETEFLEATRNYIEELFKDISSNGEKIVVLDQALPPDDLYFTNRYFRSCKNIIVERDPRDMYVTDIIDMDVVAKKKGSLESGIKFVNYFKTLVEKTNIGKDECLRIRFEDLVLNYDQTILKINGFLNLDPEKHMFKKSYLNPDRSCKNVGIYKKYYDKYKEAIDYIYTELKDYCWNG